MAGKIAETQAWRAVITLPKYANAVDGALLLQQSERVSQSAISQVLTREYLTWQVMRVRQLLDYLQQGVANGEASDAFIDANTSEILALANFPTELLKTAGLPEAAPHLPSRPVLIAPFNSSENRKALADWRDSTEATLPNLLNPDDVTRLERLLVRFVKLVPKEYRNGVHDHHITIMLEFREARQFTEQAQALSNELSPVWRRDRAEAFSQFQKPLREGLEELSLQIHKLAGQDAVDESAKNVTNLLEDKFQLSARRVGAKTDVIEETALEVRTALIDSLAAAKSDQWEQAESLRLDAYTSFDSEIEVRVLPRNPELGRRTERSFLDGSSGELGIKALLDSRAPLEELSAGYERTLQYLDQSVGLLRVSVSPATIGFTAFTILAREGLEAVIVLAALLAGLRGTENANTRRWITSGAWLALAASALTFWLSKTLIHSLSRYGEKLEAVVSILAVIILLMVTNWVFHKFYWVGWNSKIRSLSKASQQSVSTRWEWLALLGVGFLTVYREGFETTLFMQSLLLEGSLWPVMIGVLAATAFIALVGLSIFKFGVKLPYRKLLVVTGTLVVSIMVTFLGSTVRLFQTVGWMPIHPIPSLNIPAWAGLWFGLYPSWEGLFIPPLALVYVGGTWLWVRIHSRLTNTAPTPDAVQTNSKSQKTMKKKQTLTALVLGALIALSSLKTIAAPYQLESPISTTSTSGGTPSAPSQPGMPDGLRGPEDTFWNRDTFTGNWGGLREQLLYKGIAITTVYTGEVFGNTGGTKQGVVADGLFNIALDLDLERLTGFWKDATIHANMLYIYGSSLSAQYVGDFGGTSNIAGYNSIRLQELWLEQGFWDKRISLRAGMLAADTEFFTSDSASLFINGTFGAFTLFGMNFPDAPVYPIANPGIRLNIAPTSNFYSKAAVFGMNSNSDPAGNNAHGTYWNINQGDGALFLVEFGYLINQSPGDKGLTGTYKLGSIIQHGDFTTWQSQADEALGTGQLSNQGTNYAVYGVVDQQIYVHGGQTVSVFGRGGFAPQQYSFVSGYFDAGFNFTGFIPGRPSDVAGIAVAFSSISNDFSNSQALQGNSRSTSETVIEATYKVDIAPWWSIQPDLQFIVNPSGVQGSNNAFVIGVRTTLKF